MVHGCPSIDRWHRRGSTQRPAGQPLIGVFNPVNYGHLGFGTWALLAPLASAVVASGSFVATGQNKQVQHFEGGIIREILVKEGDLVDANQPSRATRRDRRKVKTYGALPFSGTG